MTVYHILICTLFILPFPPSVMFPSLVSPNCNLPFSVEVRCENLGIHIFLKNSFKKLPPPPPFHHEFLPHHHTLSFLESATSNCELNLSFCSLPLLKIMWHCSSSSPKHFPFTQCLLYSCPLVLFKIVWEKNLKHSRICDIPVLWVVLFVQEEKEIVLHSHLIIATRASLKHF